MGEKKVQYAWNKLGCMVRHLTTFWDKNSKKPAFIAPYWLHPAASSISLQKSLVFSVLLTLHDESFGHSPNSHSWCCTLLHIEPEKESQTLTTSSPPEPPPPPSPTNHRVDLIVRLSVLESQQKLPGHSPANSKVGKVRDGEISDAVRQFGKHFD